MTRCTELNSSVIVASHTVSRPLGVMAVVNYINKNNDYNVRYLLHPLKTYAGRFSSYENGKHNIRIRRHNLGIINLFIDLLISLYFIVVNRCDYFIGASNFDTLPAVIAKKVFKVKIRQVIYHPRDYAVRIGSKGIYARLYIAVEKIIIKGADLTISNSGRSESARIKLGLDPSKSIKIPNPLDVGWTVVPDKKLDRSKFIYVGDVSRQHGLSEFLKEMQPKECSLTIIGRDSGGDDWEEVLRVVKSMNITLSAYNNKSHEETLKILYEFSGFGLAPYNQLSDWTFYASPLKVGEYIAAGIPVIISDIPEVSETIRDENLGVVYSHAEPLDIRQHLEGLNRDKFLESAQKYLNNSRTDILFESYPLQPKRHHI